MVFFYTKNNLKHIVILELVEVSELGTELHEVFLCGLSSLREIKQSVNQWRFYVSQSFTKFFLSGLSFLREILIICGGVF